MLVAVNELQLVEQRPLQRLGATLISQAAHHRLRDRDFFSRRKTIQGGEIQAFDDPQRIPRSQQQLLNGRAVICVVDTIRHESVVHHVQRLQ